MNHIVSDATEHAANRRREEQMLGWALTFLIIAIITAILGFGVLASMAATIAKILFVIFIILFIISLIMRLAGRGRGSVV
jgi:uncharacterized membrane protein YtjA (UPF0391 family)